MQRAAGCSFVRHLSGFTRRQIDFRQYQLNGSESELCRSLGWYRRRQWLFYWHTRAIGRRLDDSECEYRVGVSMQSSKLINESLLVSADRMAIGVLGDRRIAHC